jgi:D-alanyl-lipoteichoic acid acyltransferase DltB (MBOAT superfamily)
MRNFAYPYFSRDMAEFWRRWHISLSTWFRDYLYIPLGGSRGTKWSQIRNSLIVFAVSGFWHGASWNFLIWGLLNGFYFIPLLLRNSNRKHLGDVAEGRMLPTMSELTGMVGTFLLACVAWVFFRAKDLSSAMDVFANTFSHSFFRPPELVQKSLMLPLVFCVFVMIALEWFSRDRQYGLQLDGRAPRWLRICIYYGVVVLIIAFAPITNASFIYFQF